MIYFLLILKVSQKKDKSNSKDQEKQIAKSNDSENQQKSEKKDPNTQEVNLYIILIN